MDNIISLRNINKIYGTEVKTQVLFDISLDIAEQSFSSIIGASGSGKSTLLNIISTLDRPTSGSVRIAGVDTTDMSRADLARLRNQSIGFVFQFHYLLPEFSVLENVLMPGRIAGVPVPKLVSRAEESLALLGLEGLEKKNANDLSGGQKQRVAIARALTNRPALVLADEPTGNLDTANTKTVYELFRRINEEIGTAFVIVTHDRAVAQQTDRILEVSDGVLLQDVRNQYLAPSAGREAAPGPV